MTSKYDNIWDCLSKNDFKPDIPEKFHCIICKNVTIEPYVASCECRFCYKCIKEHLKDLKRNCPGEKSECKEESLKLDVNVLRDIVSIRSIAQLKVKCPNDMCEARRTLDNMSDHIRICGISSVKCPYEVMGCDGGQISKDNIKTHYDDEWFTHSQLLVESIDILRNEVNRLSKDMERKDKQINKLIQDSVEQKMTIMKTEQELVEQRREFDDQKLKVNAIIEKYEKRENEIEMLKEELKIIKEIQIMQVEEQSKDLCALKNKDERKESEIEVIKEKLSLIKKRQKKLITEDLENINKHITEIDLREEIKNQKKLLSELKGNQKGLDKKIISEITCKNKQLFDDNNFFWIVDNFSKMRGNNGRWKRVILHKFSLKFSLSLWCEGFDFIFYCRIMKGEFDDLLEWPMKHTITLSVIHRNTMKIYKIKSYNHETYLNKNAFDKPIDEWRNYYIGDDSFTTIKEIMETPGLLVNDSLIVSFNISCKS